MRRTERPIDDLFNQFLEVCNQAMEAHKDEFPYKQIWEAAEQLQREKGLHVTIYDDEPKGDFQLRLQDKHIELLSDSEDDSGEGWRINKSYMKRVVENPEEYIEEPAKLDWDWLKNRLFD